MAKVPHIRQRMEEHSTPYTAALGQSDAEAGTDQDRVATTARHTSFESSHVSIRPPVTICSTCATQCLCLKGEHTEVAMCSLMQSWQQTLKEILGVLIRHHIR